jgi:hypothetical protein
MAAPRQRLHQRGLGAERAADLGDALRQAVIRHVKPGRGLLDQRLARDDLALLLGERPQDGARLGTLRHLAARAIAQRRAREVEDEAADRQRAAGLWVGRHDARAASRPP